jgi:putative peptidoglycan lipid II flippase
VGTLSNIALSLVLMQFIGVGGIALATGLTAWLQAVMHYWILHRQSDFTLTRELKHTALKVLVASALMAAGSFAVYYAVMELHKIPALIAVVGSGSLIYGLSVLGLGVIKLSDLKALVKRS